MSESPNPYAPSQAQQKPELDGLSCPRCNSTDIKTPRFTWWGGALGPRLLKHRVCRSCAYSFNAATGEPNRKKVIAYAVIVNAIALALAIALLW